MLNCNGLSEAFCFFGLAAFAFLALAAVRVAFFCACSSCLEASILTAGGATSLSISIFSSSLGAAALRLGASPAAITAAATV
jgi:hypothetical protein